MVGDGLKDTRCVHKALSKVSQPVNLPRSKPASAAGCPKFALLQPFRYYCCDMEGQSVYFLVIKISYECVKLENRTKTLRETWVTSLISILLWPSLDSCGADKLLYAGQPNIIQQLLVIMLSGFQSTPLIISLGQCQRRKYSVFGYVQYCLFFSICNVQTVVVRYSQWVS